MLDIQHYIEYFVKKHEKSTIIPPIHVYINRINNRLVLPRHEVVEVVLVQCNLKDNQYQQKYEVLCTQILCLFVKF